MLVRHNMAASQFDKPMAASMAAIDQQPSDLRLLSAPLMNKAAQPIGLNQCEQAAGVTWVNGQSDVVVRPPPPLVCRTPPN